jgi:hypothetical protein
VTATRAWTRRSTWMALAALLALAAGLASSSLVGTPSIGRDDAAPTVAIHSAGRVASVHTAARLRSHDRSSVRTAKPLVWTGPAPTPSALPLAGRASYGTSVSDARGTAAPHQPRGPPSA